MGDDSFCTPPEGTNFYDQDHLARCLTTIEAHIGNSVWLVTHLEFAHKTLRGALEVDPLVHRAIHDFIRMIPDFMLTDNYTEPLERTFQALLRAMELKDPNLLTQVAGAMAVFNPLKGDIPRAYSNARTAINYAKGATDVDAILHAYVRIMQALSYRRFEKMPTELIQEALDLAVFSSDKRLVTEVHLTMSHLYAHLEELTEAEEHANIAFSLADQLRDNNFKMRALLMLGVVCRLSRDMEAAELYVQSALDLSDGVQSERRLGIMLCELAGLRFMQGKLDESEHLYLRAKAMFEHLKLPYNVVLAEHGLGLVRILLGRYDEARANLQGALDEYRWNHNTYGVADINFALGRCEARAGDSHAALTYLRAANGLAYQLDPNPARNDLLYWIRQWIDRVQRGEFGTA